MCIQDNYIIMHNKQTWHKNDNTYIKYWSLLIVLINKSYPLKIEMYQILNVAKYK